MKYFKLFPGWDLSDSKKEAIYEEFPYQELNDCSNILVVGGDSWSNRIHVLQEQHGEKHWIKIFAPEKKFDAVIVCACGGDSNKAIFKNLISLFSYSKLEDWGNKSNESWLNTNKLEGKNVSVIVQWSSTIRDFSEETAWYRPYTWASQPNWEKLDKDMYTEYINNIFLEKIYSHKTQLYSWQLQKYFEKWNMPYYFWMGFCDLVPDEAKNTEFDIRHLLNKDRWFNLYERPNNMLDYLDFLSKQRIPEPIPGILTEGSIEGLKKSLGKVREMFNKVQETSAHNAGYFHHDLHPNSGGHEKIAEILLERF